jgi:hypothetical protein
VAVILSTHLLIVWVTETFVPVTSGANNTMGHVGKHLTGHVTANIHYMTLRLLRVD